MKSLWPENKTLSYKEDHPKPAQKDEALIRVRLAGICGTDIEMVNNY